MPGQTAGVSGTANLHPATTSAISPAAAQVLAALLEQQGAAAATTTPATTATAGGGASKKKVPTGFELLFGVDLTSAMFFVAGLMVAILAIYLLFVVAARGVAQAAGPEVIRTATEAAKLAAI